MSNLLYYSIANHLTEDEIIMMDSEVQENRRTVYLFIRKLPRRSNKIAKRIAKQFGLSVIVITSVLPLFAQPSNGVSVTPNTNHYEKLVFYDYNQQKKYQTPQIASFQQSKNPKICFTKEQIHRCYGLLSQYQAGELTIDQVVEKMRGGALDIYDIMEIILFVYIMFFHKDFPSAEGFVQPPQYYNPFDFFTGKIVKRHDPFCTDTNLKMEKPPEMSHHEYVGLTKLQRRRLPDPRGRDILINVGDYPELDIPYYQALYKTPKHGIIYDLFVDENNRTPKTEANAKAIQKAIVEMAHDPSTIWYVDGQFQGGTERGYQTINLYNQKTGKIVVFEKLPEKRNSFLTTAKLTPDEHDHLIYSNGNFLTQAMLDEQGWKKPSETHLNRTSTTSQSTSPNLGFTSINSFQSDVMGITPRNPDW